MSKPAAPQPDGAYHRQSERKLFVSTARFVSDGNLYQVKTLDISNGGASIIAQVNHAIDAMCLIELMLPTTLHKYSTIHVWVRVAYSFHSASEGGFKIGLQFMDLNPNDQAALQAFTSK